MTVPKILLRPVQCPISSPFGAPRNNAVGYHTGTDYACPGGTQIRAAHKGRVVVKRTGSFNGDQLAGGYGNQVWLENDLGSYGTVYAHMERIFVMQGDKVGRGQVIGTVDNTGISTGNHIHFEVRDRLNTEAGAWGSVVNPELYYGNPTEDTMTGEQKLKSIVVLHAAEESNIHNAPILETNALIQTGSGYVKGQEATAAQKQVAAAVAGKMDYNLTLAERSVLRNL